jgi:hypothetical protein
VDSTKDSPKDKSSTTQGKVAAGASPKPKESDKDSEKEVFTVKAFKMLMDNHKETLEVLLNNKAAMTEDEKMDQEDQRIKEVELGKLDEVNENASIACGDWLHRVRPVICNLSKREKRYWTLVEEVVNERYKAHLMLSPVEKLSKEYKDHEEADKEEFARVKAIIHEMILKALPKEIVTEAIQKRYKDLIQMMLFLMIKYQPGSRKEREVILHQIGFPEAGWNEESALTNLRLWKRRTERAKEL